MSEEPAFWSIQNGGALNGGMMPLPDGAPARRTGSRTSPPDRLDESARLLGELGGRVIVPATAVPSGRFLVATDPQGAAFALFEGEVDP